MIFIKLLSVISWIFFLSLSKNPYFLILALFLTTLKVMFHLHQTILIQWYSFLLLLMFIGGLLIMFLYLISLVPKESFMLKLWFPMIIIILSMIMKIPPSSTLSMSMTHPTLMYYYSSLMLFTILFLLLTLFTTTTLASTKAGPLRLK